MADHSIVTLSRAPQAELEAPQPKPTAVTPGLVEASTTIWESVDGKTSVGVWECSPGSFTAHRDGYSEICQLLTGSVTVDTDGEGSVTLHAGDTLVMPDGWSGVWHVHEQLRKTYVTVTS
jgi:uncharacterized cupin superfamily protein